MEAFHACLFFMGLPPASKAGEDSRRDALCWPEDAPHHPAVTVRHGIAAIAAVATIAAVAAIVARRDERNEVPR